jgi:hypothetical protein
MVVVVVCLCLLCVCVCVCVCVCGERLSVSEQERCQFPHCTIIGKFLYSLQYSSKCSFLTNGGFPLAQFLDNDITVMI